MPISALAQAVEFFQRPALEHAEHEFLVREDVQPAVAVIIAKGCGTAAIKAGQNAGQATGEHRFATAGRSTHQ